MNGFTSVTGSYTATNASGQMGTVNSGLDFYDKIADGSFKLWLYAPDGTVVSETNIVIDADTTTMADLSTTIGSLGEFNSSIVDGALNIEIDQSSYAGYTFAFSDDSSNILAALGINTFFTSSNARNMGINDNILLDKNNIAAGKVSSTGEFFSGDNTNSLDMSNLQYTNVTVKQWSYSRSEGGSSLDVTNVTLDEYLHQMVGSIGIESQSIQREKDYNNAIQEQMSITRDNISAVSLDEEMADLIRYQHAYMAAAKLITTAQEMLDEILKAV